MGARPADAHRDMALMLHCLSKDARGAYQHALRARLAAAAAGQESQQALACYEAAMYLLQVCGNQGPPTTLLLAFFSSVNWVASMCMQNPGMPRQDCMVQGNGAELQERDTALACCARQFLPSGPLGPHWSNKCKSLQCAG